jgi:uncharacterized protein YdeI (YjbR/CyaY-like superfamily)
MPKIDRRIDAYIAKSAEFAQPILKHLRQVVHAGCPDVEETVRWSMPAFMYKGPLAGMAAFKQHCTFGFWKGSLLADRGLPQGAEAAMGHFGRITSLSDLPDDRLLIRLVKDAAALNDRGIKVPRRKPPTDRKLTVPSFLKQALGKNKKARATFDGFSYSNKKEYVEWLVEAKTDETRKRRLDTALLWMAEGKSRNWKYERE